MKLNVLERIILMGVLPQEASYLNHKILTNLRAELSFSEKEIKDYNIVEQEGKIFWDDKKEKPKEISIGEKAQDIIFKALKLLDEEGKINSQNASLYEKFVLPVN